MKRYMREMGRSRSAKLRAAEAQVGWNADGSRRLAGGEVQTAVEPEHRHEHEKAELRPRLDVLEARLAMSRGFILGALKEAGLTVVVLKDPQ